MTAANPDLVSDGVLSLTTTPIHFSAGGGAVPINGFAFDPASFESYISGHTNASDPGRLGFIEHSAESWKLWERHPAGDEVVVVVSGVALFIQEIDGAQQHARVGAGEAIINPAGVWHTADVEEPFSALYLTPCPGTNHRPRETPPG